MARPQDSEIPHHTQDLKASPPICKARVIDHKKTPLVLADFEALFVYLCTKITFLLQRIGRVLSMVQKSKLMDAIEAAVFTFIAHIFPATADAQFATDFSVSASVLESLINLACLCFCGLDDLPLQFRMAAIRSLLDVPEQIVSILAASLTPFPETLATALAKLEMANIFGPTEIPKILSAMEETGVPLTIDAILACGDLGTLKTWLDLENLRDQDLLDQLVENSDHIDQYTNLEVKPDSLPTSASLLSSAGSSAPDLSYLNDYSPSLSPPSRMESPSGYPPTSQSPPAILTQEPLPLPLRRSISPNMKFQIPSLATNTLCSKSNLAIRRSNLGSKSSHNSTPASDVPQTPLFTPIVSWEPLINPGELVVLPGADQASLMPTHRTPTPPSSPLSPPPSSDVELVQNSPISPLASKLGGKEPTQNIPTCVPTLEPESKVSGRERSVSHSNPRLTIPRGRYGLRSASLSERARPASDTDELGNGGGIGSNTAFTSALATISTKKAHGKGRAMPSSHATAPRLALRASRMRAVSSNKENQE